VESTGRLGTSHAMAVANFFSESTFVAIKVLAIKQRCAKKGGEASNGRNFMMTFMKSRM
jgi:hypothetical protein